MTAISFSCVEKLKGLLSKECTQTIRPLFNIEIYKKTGKVVRKKSRFKVGEKIRLYWKQRSKYKYFWVRNGSGSRLNPDKCIGLLKKALFNKLLGEVEITEMFEIEMWVGNDAPLISGYKLKDTYDLAKRDGFKPDNKYIDFYNFFIKEYGLDKPLPFEVIRW